MTSDRFDRDIDCAYVGDDRQLRLFNPRSCEVCREIGLNWLAALRLRDGGWLSFDPEAQRELSESDETELRFVGSLVACGFDENQLEIFLEGLRKPYRYRIERIYFDWLARRWSLLPLPSSVGLDEIRSAIGILREEGATDDLRSLQEEIATALEELESMKDEEAEENK